MYHIMVMWMSIQRGWLREKMELLRLKLLISKLLLQQLLLSADEL